LAATKTSLSATDQLRALRKKKLWRSLIELGETILAESNGAQIATVHAEVAKAYIEVRQYELARNHLDSAQELQPRNSAVLRRLGELESLIGNFDAAAEYWLRLFKKKGTTGADKSIYLQLARAQRNLGQLDTAHKTASAGCTRFPDSLKLRKEHHRIFSMIEDRSREFRNQTVTPTSDTTHPYRNLESKCYWNRTVSPRNCLEIENWYERKFSINGLSIASAGSCFAQHIGRALRENGYEYIDVEPAPSFLHKESHHDYGYGIYSGRFGNVYTSRQLLQLLQQSLGLFKPVDSIWKKDDGYVDALRPTIEPDPLDNPAEVTHSRKYHLDAVKQMFKLSKVFIFTMGLTETWVSNQDGTAYPVAPGVSGGKHDSTQYTFKNFSYSDVLSDMEEFIHLVRGINPSLKIILTVSPVPLMATATTDNVIVASSYSKSVLRAVAGFLKDQYEFVDYFPSFEIVGSHVMRGQFFNPDGRSVSSFGVSHVMQQFFREHVPPDVVYDEQPKSVDPDEIVCDEELLNEFGSS